MNVIRLLADLNVSVNKPEIVDMILPLFIESLEEGDASTAGLLRLRVSRSPTVKLVLMTRSYLCKLSSVGSAESRTQNVLETLPAGFLLIPRGLTSDKLSPDYRHKLLSLCSDVGLAAESKSGRSGANFLGLLLPAVAEICSDFEV